MIKRLIPLWSILAILLALSGCGDHAKRQETVKLGLLHSQSGTLAASEKPVANAVKLAVLEINESGALPGVRLELVERDGRSDERAFAQAAEELLRDENVAAIFGGWTSASRKAMLPALERHNALLFYPVQYEGVESSPHVVYLGAAPNQQIIPAVYWAMHDQGAKRFFLVGSDYIFPRMANEIIKDQVKALGGEIVGERYLPLGSAGQAPDIAAEIAKTRPDFILNTINGDTNRDFFLALREADVTSTDIPTLSFSVDENLLREAGARLFSGDYAAWNYFQSVPGDANRDFVNRYKKAYGSDQVVSDAMESAYNGVYLWAEAVKKAAQQSERCKALDCQPDSVREHIANRSVQGPGGLVFVDPETQHLYKTARVGQILDDGQFLPVWSSNAPVRPEPYPIFRPMEAWVEHMDFLRKSWNGQWSAPEDN